MSTEKKITTQERKYRWLTTALLNNLFTSTLNTIQQMPVGCSVDVRLTATTEDNIEHTYDIEVKEMKGNYSTSILRVGKFEAMQKAHINQNLMYISFKVDKVKQTCTAIVYDLNKIDMKHLPIIQCELKDTEFDTNSSSKKVPCYLFQHSQAVKQIDCTELYRSYANNI